MTKNKTFRGAALNVRIHDPEHRDYIRLITLLAQRRTRVKLHGSHRAIFGAPSIGEDPEFGNIAVGYLHKFLDFDAAQSWIDTNSLRTVDPAQISESLRESPVRPEAATGAFLFLEKSHRLIIDADIIPPIVAAKGLQRVLNTPEFTDEFGEATVTVEQSSTLLAELLELPQIFQITIKIIRPNSEDGDDLSDIVEEQLAHDGAREIELELKSFRGKSLKLDEKIKALSELARTNGSVFVNGKDSDGSARRESTAKTPAQHSEQYDSSDPQSHFEAIRSVARRFILKAKDIVS